MHLYAGFLVAAKALLDRNPKPTENGSTHQLQPVVVLDTTRLSVPQAYAKTSAVQKR